ncbi:MAG: flagellar hook-associated protein FlgL, partial [Clostridium sp.]|nr:flagellar hook-associated protein FlgL [Clostridium sp.]
MRITTKVIQNNSLNNINTNKLLQDKLSQQMSTEKKVNRPSDDPIVAIRALRLRTNVNQINQYYEKNVPDAESWLEVTESALSSMSDVVTDMIDQCIKGSNEDLTTEDRETILTALKALRDEVYATGNSDYAGRYIFSGYRTDTPLTFETGTEQLYTITEQLTNAKIDKITYVDSGNVLDINDANYSTAPNDAITEYEITQSEIHRIRLSYDNVEDAAIEFTDVNGDPILVNGNSITCENMSMYATPDSPYSLISTPAYADKVILVKETGELLLGDNVYNKLMSMQDTVGTAENEGEIRIQYQKEHWNGNDLRPEHYFACETEKDGKLVTYNGDYLNGISDEEKQ